MSETSPRFIDNEDETVMDCQTGLVWLKNANFFGAMTWDAAREMVANPASGLPATDTAWHLPTIVELQGLLDPRFSPSISNARGSGRWPPGNLFDNVQLTHFYWSGSEYTGRTEDPGCRTVVGTKPRDTVIGALQDIARSIGDSTKRAQSNDAWAMLVGEGNVANMDKNGAFAVWPVRDA